MAKIMLNSTANGRRRFGKTFEELWTDY